MRSPPERLATFFCWSRAAEIERAAVGARVHRARAEGDLVLAAADLLPDGLVAVERPHLVGVGQLDRLADADRAAVGFSLPGDHPSRVVLPAPFGPITPTMEPGGIAALKLSSSRRSP